MKFFKKKQSGFTLIEIMIAGALLAGLGLAAMKLTQDSTHNQKVVSLKALVLDEELKVTEGLNRESVCKYVFGKAFSGRIITPSTNLTSTYKSFAIPLATGGEKVHWSAGSQLSDPKAKISDLNYTLTNIAAVGSPSNLQGNLTMITNFAYCNKVNGCQTDADYFVKSKTVQKTIQFTVGSDNKIIMTGTEPQATCLEGAQNDQKEEVCKAEIRSFLSEVHNSTKGMTSIQSTSSWTFPSCEDNYKVVLKENPTINVPSNSSPVNIDLRNTIGPLRVGSGNDYFPRNYYMEGRDNVDCSLVDKTGFKCGGTQILLGEETSSWSSSRSGYDPAPVATTNVKVYKKDSGSGLFEEQPISDFQRKYCTNTDPNATDTGCRYTFSLSLNNNTPIPMYRIVYAGSASVGDVPASGRTVPVVHNLNIMENFHRVIITLRGTSGSTAAEDAKVSFAISNITKNSFDVRLSENAAGTQSLWMDYIIVHYFTY